MHQADDETGLANYPRGRGYGHDYMRGGEVLGGYGYAEREEYSRARGDLNGAPDDESSSERGDGQARQRAEEIRT